MIANDPGHPKTGAAWARFLNKDLVDCDLWGRRKPFRAQGEEIVIELPMVYPKSPVPPNDIARLAFRAGRVAQYLCHWEEEPVLVPAGTWKSNIPPDILCDRVIRKLTERELFIYASVTDAIAAGYRHNVADAIGLGLYRLKRMARGGV